MRKEVLVLGAIAAVVIAAAFIGARFYRNSTQSNVVSYDADALKKQNELLIREDSKTLGAKDAKVTIVEFLDPECESCAAFDPIVKKVLGDNKQNARLVVRYMPLHPNSLSAATFIEAAGEQGKYWEALKLLFEKQPEWGTKHGHNVNPADQPNIDVLLKKYAVELKLDMAQMNAAFAENRYASKIQRDKKDGESLGVSKTPTVFVNGRQLTTLSEPALRSLVGQELSR